MIVESFSHRGYVRERNEDSLLVSEETGLFVVADGMGGANAGDVASALAVEAIQNELAELDPIAGLRPSEVLREARSQSLAAAITQANAEVARCAKRNREWTGMGTTIAAVVLTPNYQGYTATIQWVGDSRVYALRSEQTDSRIDRRFYLLTKDHTYGQDAVNRGVPHDVAFADRRSHDLTQAVGVCPTVIVSIATYDLVPGDVLLLCSDGLFNDVASADIGRALYAESAGNLLLAAALDAGGHDNITGIVVRI